MNPFRLDFIRISALISFILISICKLKERGKVTPNTKALPNTGTANNPLAALGLGIATLASAFLKNKKKKESTSDVNLED